MARPNAAMRGNFQRGFKKLEQFARDIGGANSPAVDEGSKVLVKGVKAQLGRRGGPSTPGQPPRKRSGRLHKSVGRAVSGGVMRVGSGDFRAPILEYGAVIPARPSRTLKRGKRKGHQSPATKGQVIEPRPFMDAALEASRAEMTDVAVSGLKKKTAEAF